MAKITIDQEGHVLDDGSPGNDEIFFDLFGPEVVIIDPKKSGHLDWPEIFAILDTPAVVIFQEFADPFAEERDAEEVLLHLALTMTSARERSPRPQPHWARFSKAPVTAGRTRDSCRRADTKRPICIFRRWS